MSGCSASVTNNDVVPALLTPAMIALATGPTSLTTADYDESERSTQRALSPRVGRFVREPPALGSRGRDARPRVVGDDRRGCRRGGRSPAVCVVVRSRQRGRRDHHARPDDPAGFVRHRDGLINAAARATAFVAGAPVVVGAALPLRSLASTRLAQPRDGTERQPARRVVVGTGAAVVVGGGAVVVVVVGTPPVRMRGHALLAIVL